MEHVFGNSTNKTGGVLQQMAKLKNLVTVNIEEIQLEIDSLMTANQMLIDVNTSLKQDYDNLVYKHSQLTKDYNSTLDAINKLEKEEVTSTTVKVSSSVVEFDPAIHSYKSARPISKVIRNQILEAYKTVYKVDENCKTLPDFYAYVNAHICPTASKTEIEGVIYNRFDERLYH